MKMNPNRTEHDGTKINSVGPGHYNVPSSIDPKKMRGVEWKKPSSRVSTKSETGASSVGPWSYNPNKDIKPLYKYRQSAAFASSTPRKFLERENTSLASKKTKWTENEDDESEYIEDATPGPGYYFPEGLTSFKKNIKEHPFQIFGCGAERFRQSKGNYANLGPGKYYHDQNLGKTTYNKVLQNGGRRISQKDGRKVGLTVEGAHKMISKEPSVPGPGAYENKNTIESEIYKKIEKASYVPFMSSCFRFDNPLGDNENPGPGAYFSPEDQVEIKTEGEKINEVQHFFKSGTKRAGFIKRAQAETPIVGSYNLNQYDIQTKAEKVKNIPKEIEAAKGGFGSKVDRFKPQQSAIQEETGQDDQTVVQKVFSHLPTFNEMRDIEQIKKAAQNRNAKQVPFNTHEKESKPLLEPIPPGPGSYFTKGYPRWVKHSFNTLTEQNKGKLQKD